MELREDRVDIIIPCYETKDNKKLERLKESLKKFDPGYPYNLIVEDGKKPAIKHRNNALRKKSRSRYFIICDDDIEFSKDGWLKEMRSVFDDFYKVGCVGVKVKLPGTNIISHAGTFIGSIPENLLYDPYLNHVIVVRSQGEEDIGQADIIRSSFQVAGCCAMYDRLVCGYFAEMLYREHGGMDDLDYQAQIIANGYRVYYNGFVTIYHHTEKDDVKKGRKYGLKTSFSMRNRLTYIRRWGLQ